MFRSSLDHLQGVLHQTSIHKTQLNYKIDSPTYLVPKVETSGATPNSPVPVAAQSKAWFCGLWHAGIAGSNPAGDMDVCLL